MQEIKDAEKISRWLRSEGIDQYFDTPDLKFRAYQFEKNELIAGPHVMLEDILFLVEGVLQIYGIHADGAMSPVNSLTKPSILGDVEFCGGGFSPFYVEAKTQVICLALSAREYGEVLNRDLKFLHVLIKSFVTKLNFFGAFHVESASIEDRVMAYLERIDPEHEIKGIEAATLQLQCSRRQLQRVLKKLCDEGKIVKSGKGRYRLL